MLQHSCRSLICGYDDITVLLKDPGWKNEVTFLYLRPSKIAISHCFSWQNSPAKRALHVCVMAQYLQLVVLRFTVVPRTLKAESLFTQFILVVALPCELNWRHIVIPPVEGIDSDSFFLVNNLYLWSASMFMSYEGWKNSDLAVFCAKQCVCKPVGEWKHNSYLNDLVLFVNANACKRNWHLLRTDIFT